MKKKTMRSRRQNAAAGVFSDRAALSPVPHAADLGPCSPKDRSFPDTQKRDKKRTNEKCKCIVHPTKMKKYATTSN